MHPEDYYEYDDAADIPYIIEGWYKKSDDGAVNCPIEYEITHWMTLPEIPRRK